MPTISSFLGIDITIRLREHNPPHFHATYAGEDMSVNIHTFEIDGTPSPRIRAILLEWADLHREELLAAWEAIKAGKNPGKIAPLR